MRRGPAARKYGVKALPLGICTVLWSLYLKSLRFFLYSGQPETYTLASLAGTKSQFKPPPTQKVILHPQELQSAPSQLSSKANPPNRGSPHPQSKHRHRAGQTEKPPGFSKHTSAPLQPGSSPEAALSTSVTASRGCPAPAGVCMWSLRVPKMPQQA